MFQADATIAWVDQNGMAQAQDYYLSSYVQVRSLVFNIGSMLKPIDVQNLEYLKIL